MEQLNNVPEGQKVHLDKKILEELLFEEIVIDESKGWIAKLPVWSGEFLRKIDLSEVSFENVSWVLLSWPEHVYEYLDYDKAEDIDSLIYKLRPDPKKYKINYSYTNANIDLANSFEAKNFKEIFLQDCIFEGINFKNQDLSDCSKLDLVCSNIANTGIIIPQKIKFIATKSDLSNVDLSNRRINAVKYLELDDGEDLDLCNLSNTGVKIDFDVIDFIIKYGTHLDSVIKDLKEAKNKNWIGCYINGKKIEQAQDLSFTENISVTPELSENDNYKKI